MHFDAQKALLLLIARGMSKADLQHAANISESTVNTLLLHDRKPNTKTIGRIAAALNVEPSELMT